MDKHLKAIKDWDIPFLENFLYNTEKESYEPFFDFLNEKINQKEKKVLFQFILNTCIKSCEFCLFKKGEYSFIELDEWNIYLNKLWEKKIKSILFSIGFFSDKQLLTSYFDRIKDFNIEYFVDIDFHFLNEKEDFLFFFSYPIKGIFIDSIPLNLELRNFFPSLKDFSSQIYFSKLQKITKSYNVYLNYYLDLPGQSFNDVLQDLKYYFQFDLKGIRFIPFIPKAKSDWEFFDQACSFHLLKISGLVRYFNLNYEIFIDNTILKLSYQNILQETLKKGINTYIHTMDFELLSSENWIIDKLNKEFKNLSFKN